MFLTGTVGTYTSPFLANGAYAVSFGGFDAPFYAAYEEAWPLPEGMKKLARLCTKNMPIAEIAPGSWLTGRLMP